MDSIRAFAAVLVLIAPLLYVQAQDTGHQSSSTRSMTAEKWRADLRFMAAEIEKLHKDAFHRVSRDAFLKEVDALEKKIQMLEDHEVVVEMMRLVAMVGDGHTGLRWGAHLGASGVLPIRCYQFEDGIFVKDSLHEQKDLLGARVVAVNGIPVERAFEKLTPYIWRDNQMGIKSTAPVYLSVPPILHAIGLSGSKNSVRFTVSKDGRERVIDLRPTANLNELWDPPPTWTSARRGDVSVPLWQKHPTDNFWYEFIPGSKTFYIQFNSVQNKQNETVEAFFGRAFKAAEDQGAERLVIDLRRNGGGNNYLNLPLTIGAVRSKLNVRGKFFVIIGRETFSAAQNAVNDLEKYTNAIFVGEPTGASPNHFGDARPVVLPNSQIRLQASTLWWQDKDPRDIRVWKAPDVAADMTFEHYRTGRDPAIEAILNYKPEKDLTEIVGDARRTGDLKTFIAEYKEFKANPAHKYQDTETTLNRVGHFLLNNRREDDALAIFTLNAAENPTSGVVFQSLGDYYGFKGDKANALSNYEKAVKLDPNLTASREAIKNLKAN